MPIDTERLHAPHWFRKRVETAIVRHSRNHVTLHDMTEIAEELWEVLPELVKQKEAP